MQNMNKGSHFWQLAPSEPEDHAYSFLQEL